MTTDDQLRAAICCPNGCLDPHRCDRNRKEVREAAEAVARLIAEYDKPLWDSGARFNQYGFW